VIRTFSLDDLALKNTWLTVGIFDGVHLGHQKLLRALINGSHAENSLAVVLTFTPHPAVILGGKTDFKSLSTPEERLSLFEGMGVDVVVTQEFNHEFANQTAEEFMERIDRQIGLRKLLIGYDTALGQGRTGDSNRLIEIGKKLGYEVTIIPPLADEMGIISSTRIKQLISSGQVSEAAGDLGRFYDLAGTVIHGDGRGHKINIPTANIRAPSGKVIPANGIYACWARVEKTNGKNSSSLKKEEKYMAATNVGIRPTFSPHLLSPAIEAHLLDFTGNLYDLQLRLEFAEYLRPEEKYISVTALVRQIEEDIQQTRKILAG
jgi:riboflavin kinase/FMN adenylyltransferase